MFALIFLSLIAGHWLLLRYSSIFGPPLWIVEERFESVYQGAEVLYLSSRLDPGECAYDVTIVYWGVVGEGAGLFKTHECWEPNDEAGHDWQSNGPLYPMGEPTLLAEISR